MMKRWFSVAVLCIIGHQAFSQGTGKPSLKGQEGSLTLTILGIAQDGGYPQIGCRKPCCEAIRKGTGARALRSMIERIMLDVMFDCPSRDDISEVTLNRAVVEG
jgi:hypothetical protein